MQIGDFREDWSGGVGPAVWEISTSESTAAVEAGRLMARFGDSRWPEVWANTVQKFAWAGSAVFFELEVNLTGPEQEFGFGAYTTGATGELYIYHDPDLGHDVIEVWRHGVSIPYDSAAHRWLRLAVSADGLSEEWATSPDPALGWTTLAAGPTSGAALGEYELWFQFFGGDVGFDHTHPAGAYAAIGAINIAAPAGPHLTATTTPCEPLVVLTVTE